MKNLSALIALSITVLIEIIVLYYIDHHSAKRDPVVKTFISLIICMIFWCVGLIIQIIMINY